MTNVYLDIINAVRKKNPNFVLFNKKTMDVHEYFKSVLVEVSSLPDTLWNSLDTASQMWFNDSVYLLEGGKKITGCPGFSIEPEDRPIITSRPVIEKKEVSVKEEPVKEEVAKEEDPVEEEPVEEVTEKKRRGRPPGKPTAVVPAKEKFEKVFEEVGAIIEESTQRPKEKKGSRLRATDTSPEQYEAIRTKMLVDGINMEKKDLVEFVERHEIPLHHLILHRIYIEGRHFSKIYHNLIKKG